MNGAEAAQLRDAIVAARWGKVLEVHVVQEVLGAELDGRELKIIDLIKLFRQWADQTVRDAIRHLLTRQVLQKSGKILFIQRDIERWQDPRGRKMFDKNESAAVLEARREEAAAGTPKPVDLRPRPGKKPKPDTPETVKAKAIRAKGIGDLLRNVLKGNQ